MFYLLVALKGGCLAPAPEQAVRAGQQNLFFEPDHSAGRSKPIRLGRAFVAGPGKSGIFTGACAFKAVIKRSYLAGECSGKGWLRL